METNITVSTVRALYENLVNPASQFIPALNEVTNKLMTSDIWHGCSDEVVFPSSAATSLVLPRQFIAILGYTIDGIPLPTFGTFHQYIERGLGWVNPDHMGTFGLIADTDVCCQVPVSGTATLRVKPSLAVDAGKVIRFYGSDENSQPIYTAPSGIEGIDLTTATPSSTTTQQFTHLSMVRCQVPMLGNWTLWQVVDGVETQIGTYYPFDMIPTFRRYKIGLRQTADVIRCFCRRQWMPVWHDTDPVFPGHLPALKYGFKARQLDNANKTGSSNSPNADDMWQRAENELDRLLSVRRGSELPSLRLIGGPYPQAQSFVN